MPVNKQEKSFDTLGVQAGLPRCGGASPFTASIAKLQSATITTLYNILVGEQLVGPKAHQDLYLPAK